MASSGYDEKARNVVRVLVRLYLEVERGFREPDQLKRLLGGDARRIKFAVQAERFPNEGPVTAKDIGRIHLNSDREGRVFAAVAARQTGDRWGGFTVELREVAEGRWQVKSMSRVHHHLVQGRDTDVGSSLDNLSAAVHNTLADRRALAPVSSTRTEHGQSPGAGPASAQGGPGEALDQQAHLLLARQRAAQEVQPTFDPGLIDSPPEHLTKLLGPPPRDLDAEADWISAASLIEGYRRRWAIDDADVALGDLAEDPVQARDRGAVVERLRTLIRRISELERDELGGPTRTSGVERV